MPYSRIKAGLCALAALAVLGGAAGAAQAQDEVSSAHQADAAHLLARRIHEGLPLEARLAFERRLDLCRDAPDGCALLAADLLTYEAPVTGADAAPVRLIRSPATLLPGSDGAIASTGLTAAHSGMSQPQALDTQAPVVQSVSLRPSAVTVDQGETTVSIDYEITDEGGSYLDEMLVTLRNQDADITAPDIRVGQVNLGGNRASGTVSVELGRYVREGDYKLSLIVSDNADNFTYAEDGPVLTVSNANADAEAPVLDALHFTPDPLVLDGEDGLLTVDYTISDVGPSGLDTITFGLRHASMGDGSASVGHVLVRLNGEARQQGRVVMTVPASTPPGEYHLRIVATDNADNRLFLNITDPSDDRVVTIDNPDADTTPPVVNRLSLTPNTVETSNVGATLRLDYDLEDLQAGLDFLWMSLISADPSQRTSRLTGPRLEFNAAQSARGSLNWSLPANFPAGAYYVEAWLQDAVKNQAGGQNLLGVATTQVIWVNEPGKRAFGPFPDVIEPDGEGRDIFRIAGLENGPPQQIEVGFRDAETGGFDGAFSDCSLEIQPGRHSGAEYLILAQDLAACGAFGSADLVVQITPQAGDLNGRITMRRFRLSETGMLTDMAADRSPLSRWTESRGEVEFGPFEWTETASSGRLHLFRLSGLTRTIPESMDIAIDNAAVEGFTGSFSDCSLPIAAEDIQSGVYAFTGADLAACGDFGRADLSFRFDQIADTGEPVTLTRLVATASGSITDFSFDTLKDAPILPVAHTGGRSRIEAGTFEWTGDATAPTQNLFRISGLGDIPDAIEVAIANAAVSGYQGDYSDCSLTIRPDRAGAHDYLVSAADLAECGDFRRADLSFRITAPEAALADGVRMRRIAIGAHGDLTDFTFDHDVRASAIIRPGKDDQSNVVLGPFEWTGDHTVGTQNVFRITGVNGAPTRIQLSLDLATTGPFTGSYLDCELTIRPERASANDYVITSNDLADCGGFGRANVTFRVHANTDQFEPTVRMRRFAVTASGGLTDFGFDNQ
jgi:hypothetical protein